MNVPPDKSTSISLSMMLLASKVFDAPEFDKIKKNSQIASFEDVVENFKKDDKALSKLLSTIIIERKQKSSKLQPPQPKVSVVHQKVQKLQPINSNNHFLNMGTNYCYYKKKSTLR